MKTSSRLSRICLAAVVGIASGSWGLTLSAMGAAMGSSAPAGVVVPPSQPPVYQPPVYQPPVYVPPVAPVIPLTPPVVVTPPPVAPVITPPPQIHIPVTTPTVIPPNLNPMDVTNSWLPGSQPMVENTAALSGIKSVTDFPTEDMGKDEEPGIIARGTEVSEFKKVSAFAVKFKSGEIMASIRKPCRLGLIQTPLGDVALTGDADVIVSEQNGVLHIFNLTGNGVSVKVKFNDVAMQEEKTRAFALAPGYELIAANRKLSQSDVRRADQIARRHFKMIQNGQVAVCEYSLESVVSTSTLIAKLESTNAGPKDRRIMTDLSKMAAVLNQVNGGYGYTVEPPSMANNQQ